MGKSAPKPPDPAETAGAQTANNVSTAIANQVLGSVNQITPSGSLTYYFNGPDGQLIAPGDWSGGSSVMQTGSSGGPSGGSTLEKVNGIYTYVPQEQTSTPTYSSGSSNGAYQLTDPNTGNVYSIPQMTAVTSLTPQEQAIFDSNQAARGNLADLAANTSQRLGDHLSQGLDWSSLPSGGSASNISTPGYQGVGGLTDLNTSFANSGRIQDSINSRSGDIQMGLDGMMTSFGGGGDIQTTFADTGDITRTYGTDFSEDRRRVEEAWMSRMNPQLERDREALRTSLLNQGIREGSEAFDRAMNRSDQASTDARMQAILAGGQEQSRLADLEARRAGFENAAQQQAYNQAIGRAQFGNTAQQQDFNQNYTRAQFNNNSILNQGNFRNAAVAQAFGQDLGAGQFRNAAQQQRFGQDFARAQFANAAIAGNNDRRFSEANFANNLADRTFQNDLTMQGRMDQDRALATQEMLAARNQPINEIGALLGTGQVSMPNFVNTAGTSMPTVDRAGLENAAYQQELANWQQNQAMMGNILGVGGQVIGAGIGSGGIWA